MLDAAHGEAVSTVIVVQRVDDAGIEAQVARVGAACEVGRRRPVVTVRADIHIHASFLASAQLVQAQLCRGEKTCLKRNVSTVAKTFQQQHCQRIAESAAALAGAVTHRHSGRRLLFSFSAAGTNKQSNSPSSGRRSRSGKQSSRRPPCRRARPIRNRD